MSDTYAHLIIYDLGGEGSTFWAESFERGSHGVKFSGYNGQTLYLTYATSFAIKDKPRDKTPKGVVAEFEGIDPSEVERSL